LTFLKIQLKREYIIYSLPAGAKDLLQDEIDDLEELSKRDKKGNADSKIDGILDRISKLKSSSIFTKLAYVKSSNNNINFIEAIFHRSYKGSKDYIS
jgi:hypothetical protein